MQRIDLFFLSFFSKKKKKKQSGSRYFQTEISRNFENDVRVMHDSKRKNYFNLRFTCNKSKHTATRINKIDLQAFEIAGNSAVRSSTSVARTDFIDE